LLNPNTIISNKINILSDNWPQQILTYCGCNKTINFVDLSKKDLGVTQNVVRYQKARQKPIIKKKLVSNDNFILVAP
jgi:hypothetical protein